MHGARREPHPAPRLHTPQVRDLYARLDAAVFYCSTKNVSFGLYAYVSHVTEMQKTCKSIWGDLEADERQDELRNLVVDHYLASPGPTSQRHFLVGEPKALGSRGEVMAAGSREAARQVLVEDKEVKLQRAVRKAKADFEKAQAALRSFQDQQQKGGPSGSTAAAPAAAEQAGVSTAASGSADAGGKVKRRREKKRARRGGSDAEEDEEDEDEDDEDEEESYDEGSDEEGSDEEGSEEEGSEERSGPRKRSRPAAPSRSASAQSKTLEEDDMEDDE